MQFDIAGIVAIVRDIGVTGVILFALIGGWKGLYVWRWYYDERLADLTKQRDEWRELALGTKKRSLKASESVQNHV
jgi:hypothetical protein